MGSERVTRVFCHAEVFRSILLIRLDPSEYLRMTIVAVLGLWLVAGCQAPRAGKALSPAMASSEPDAQLEFWHSLADDPIASNDAAFHGLLLYLDGKDDAKDYPSRVATLKQRKLLPASFNEPAEAAVRRGTLAVAILKVIDERGGLTMRVLGPTPRYAVRELQFMGLYPPSTPNQSFSGNEFLGIIGKLEDYQRGDAADRPAAELPGEKG
jgi:hypothetical protein